MISRDESIQRFLRTLGIVFHEGRHLEYSRMKMSAEDLGNGWVKKLEADPELGESLEAYVSRFGRMQDTIGDKLLPRWLMALAEKPGSQIEVLNKAERLGVVSSTEKWLEARKLLNRLVLEYIEDPGVFVKDLKLSLDYVILLFETYNSVRQYALERMQIPEPDLSPSLKQ